MEIILAVKISDCGWKNK